jgi:hypothetical protein
VAAQLAVGAFKLEEAGQALSAKQAADLLPLWKAYRNLSQDSSAAALERKGLTEQIAETLARQQVAAIAAMKLTQDDLAAQMQALGIHITDRCWHFRGISHQPRIGQRPGALAAGEGSSGRMKALDVNYPSGQIACSGDEPDVMVEGLPWDVA